MEIPKATGGVGPIDVPTVLDSLIQLAVMQVLQEDWDPGFSDASYGAGSPASDLQGVGGHDDMA